MVAGFLRLAELRIGIAEISERSGFPIGVIRLAPQRQRLRMQFDGLEIVCTLSMNVRDIVKGNCGPAWIPDSSGQFERLLIRTESLTAVPQRRIYPTDVVQSDSHIPSAVVRAVDFERRKIC